jgi:hypothetical protein
VLQIPNSCTCCLCTEFLMVGTYDICLCSVVKVRLSFYIAFMKYVMHSLCMKE